MKMSGETRKSLYSYRFKVCHVLTDKNIGGAGRWLLNYLKYFDRSRFQVTVILPEDSALAKFVEASEANLILMPVMEESSYDKQAIKEFCKVFREIKPSVVHTHASLAARIAAKKTKVKVVVNTKHCMEAPEPSYFKRKMKGSINKRYSTKITAVSEAVRQSMIAGGADPEQVITIYNGIEPFPVIRKSEWDALRLQYGIGVLDFCVGMVARLEKVKDHETLLRAARRVQNKNKKVKFLLVGSGSQEDYLKAVAESLHLENCIFAGFIAEVEKITGIMDLEVITSRQEALSLSIIEAMSIGLPVLGSYTGGIKEVIEEGKNGELFQVGDDVTLARKILDLAADVDKQRYYGKNGIKTVNEKFLASNMVMEIEKLYYELLNVKG